jgi:hypothetical protein
MPFLFSFTEDVNVGEMLKQDLQFHFHIQLLQQTHVQSVNAIHATTLSVPLAGRIT